MEQTERWLPIDGYEGLYEVSDLGRVRRLKGRRAGVMTPRASGPKTSEYSQVGLRKNGGRNAFKIHRLVLRAFVGRAPSMEYVANHKNGDRKDNRLVNLEWVTRSENLQHARDVLGTIRCGEDHPLAKLTEADVHLIRASTLPITTLAKTYGVGITQISRIRHRKRWNHATA